MLAAGATCYFLALLKLDAQRKFWIKPPLPRLARFESKLSER
jgi:hypothetical protein